MTTGAITRRKKSSATDLPPSQASLKLLLESIFQKELQAGDIALDTAGAWEYNLTYRCNKKLLFAVAKQLKEHADLNFAMLIDVTCVDWLDTRAVRFELVYQFLSIANATRVVVKVAIEESDATVSSLCPLWGSANFMEREVYDMFGIGFDGHGDLRRILMYDEFVGHPLRKDYPLKAKQPRIPLRIPELRNTSGDMRKDELVAGHDVQLVSLPRGKGR